MALSCKMRLSRFSDKLKFQDRADCGNNIKVEENIISVTESVIPLEIMRDHLTRFVFLRDVSRFMKEKNVLSSSKGYVARVVQSYEAVKVEQVRKYFLSTLKFAKFYLEGETAFTVKNKMDELRKTHRGHRGAAEFEVDHSKKGYNRYR